MPIQRLKYLFRRVNTYSHILNGYSTILNTYSPSRILTNVGGCAAGAPGVSPGRPLFVPARRAHPRGVDPGALQACCKPRGGAFGSGALLHTWTGFQGAQGPWGRVWEGVAGAGRGVRSGGAVSESATPVVVVFVTIRPRVLTTRAGERIARASRYVTNIFPFLFPSLSPIGERERGIKRE
uniref:Uncharacterized protein n=1 Tax=Siphoviridae sp. ctZF426 TaxID=2827580 RepID=A0A8S5RSD2_9CAUD|nr:MAG TPA: hypothetical protein [Siphoviridae sp. ctZF426]